MTEHPIIFTGESVRAILAGTKTQTRRIIKPSPVAGSGVGGPWTWVTRTWGRSCRAVAGCADTDAFAREMVQHCPYGKPGDQLWVRENGWEPRRPTEREFRDGADTWRYTYDADGVSAEDIKDFKAWKWKRRPAIHMPRWASRLTLELTDVRVQRLQEISEEDACAEGVRYTGPFPAAVASGFLPRPDNLGRLEYQQAWAALNGKRAPWASNPWVWALTFQRTAR